MGWGLYLAKESKLVSLPPGPVLVNELKGELDSLFICHQDQGVVVVTFGDEGVGMEGLPSELGGGCGFDPWGHWWGCYWRRCLLASGLCLCLGQGQGGRMVGGHEVDDKSVEVCYRGARGR